MGEHRRPRDLKQLPHIWLKSEKVAHIGHDERGTRQGQVVQWSDWDASVGKLWRKPGVQDWLVANIFTFSLEARTELCCATSSNKAET